MAEGMSGDFRAHFLGTHLFNPPRYLKLLEIISRIDTLPEVVGAIADFCERRLGKGIVLAQDTPNFIANRIATFSSLNAARVMMEGGYSIEEVDAMTGPEGFLDAFSIPPQTYPYGPRRGAGSYTDSVHSAFTMDAD